MVLRNNRAKYPNYYNDTDFSIETQTLTTEFKITPVDWQNESLGLGGDLEPLVDAS